MKNFLSVKITFRFEEIVLLALGALLFLLSVGSRAWPAVFYGILVIGLILGLVWGDIRLQSRRWPRMVERMIRIGRDFLPFVLSVVFYALLKNLTPVLRPGVYDSWLVSADRWIFGFDPVVAVGGFYHPAFQIFLMVCYVSFFFAPWMFAALLYARPDRGAFQRYVLAVSWCLAIGYVGYLLVPAVGPYIYQAGSFSDRLPGEAGIGLMRIIDHLKGQARDGFPSLHAAGAVGILFFAWRYARRFFYVYLPFGLGLFYATVYLRVHYGVDVIAGIVLGVIVWICVETKVPIIGSSSLAGLRSKIFENWVN